MAASHVSLQSVLLSYISNTASLLPDNFGALSSTRVPDFYRPIPMAAVKRESSDTSESGPLIVTITSTSWSTSWSIITVQPDDAGATSVTSSTAVGEIDPAPSSNTEITSTSTRESSLATTVDTKTSVATQSTEPGYYTGVASVPQQSSNLPLGPIIGSALGGLAMILVAVVVLVWMSYSRRKHSESREGQEIEPENQHEAVRVGVTQLEGTSLKPELSAGSLAAVPSFVSPGPCQHEPTSFRDEILGIRYELSTEMDRVEKIGSNSVA